MEVKPGQLVFAGIDGEMSGTDPRAHKLIQIGVSFSERHVFSSRLGWSDAAYEDDALRAIGVTVAELAEGPPAAEVDEALVGWLDALGIPKGSIVPVGWAVTTFDLPFIAPQLPRFNAYLHRHAVELNTVVYFLGGLVSYHGRPATSAGWKHMAKQAAGSHVYYTQSRQLKTHDAGDDALSAILAHGWLRDVVQGAGNGDSESVLSRRAALQLTVDATRGSWF